MDAVEQIKEQISSNTILLYMKGAPNAAQDTASRMAAQALLACGENFTHVDILQYPDIRAALPGYANCSDIPQLWVAGELVGGPGTVREMYETGELHPLIKEAVAKAKK
ncbi:glutaredoxin family protein [Streptomyces sp. NPDC020472]|uniref:glutaredoxin family protein n=1 Tax=Streptomyces sp. NPDC020472 TaxID=3365075 RepID=UPI003794A36B